MKLSVAMLASVGVHAALALGAAWWIWDATDRIRMTPNLEKSAVELSLAEEDVETAAVSSGAVTPRPQPEELPRAQPKPVEAPRPEDTVPDSPVPSPDEERKLSPDEPETEVMVTPEREPEPEEKKPTPPRETAGNPSPVAPRQARIDAPLRPRRNIRPDYPRESRLRGEEGSVRIKVTVAADGTVAAVEVAESSGFAALDAAAVKAVRQARFNAARSEGKPVESSAMLELQFKLKGMK